MMTGYTYQGSIRQLPTGATSRQTYLPYTLPANQEVVIGRDPSCQIVLDSSRYGVVSRKHVRIYPLPGSQQQNAPVWQICDLASANGTYINGRRLQGCQTLQMGDRIILGQNGPQFVFECQLVGVPSQPTPSSPPVPASSSIPEPPIKQQSAVSNADAVTFSQLFPIVSTGRDLTRKAYLVPGVITVGFVVLMFIAVGNTALFNLLLAAYLAGAAYYFVYQLCGKQKPWWVLLGSALVTVLILLSPILFLFTSVFRGILPGAIPEPGEQVNFLALLVRMFFGAGLMEELLKALSVLGAYFLGKRLRSPWREQVGVWEPLDGILLGTASAVGFTLLETLGQYVPEIVQSVNLQAGEGAGDLLGLQLLIPRILGSVAGHMAYSGYLGYFIGLSVLKPSKRWRILGIGYLTAAVLHALWNATGIFSTLVLALVGVLSYAFLAAAILKARALSPTRSQNFATRFHIP